MWRIYNEEGVYLAEQNFLKRELGKTSFYNYIHASSLKRGKMRNYIFWKSYIRKRRDHGDKSSSIVIKRRM